VVGKPEEPMLEGYSALSYLAAATKRARSRRNSSRRST